METVKGVIGEQVLQFGKFEGKKIKDIPHDYIIYVAENHSPHGLNKNLISYGKILLREKANAFGW